MQKLKAFFTSPITISIIGLMAICLLIWFLGPHIKFGENNVAPLASVTSRLIAMMIAIGLWGLNNLWAQSRNKKSNSQLVSGLKESQEAPPMVAGNEHAAEELAQINDRFSQALETLKRYKFKGAKGKRALYELPWYIIVGPPGSGKTTALVNSGLEFPLAEKFGRAALQGIGGTRNCDWWFTNEAVLIDTAGRYTTQDSHKVADSSAWEGFLQLLKRNRRRRPINGAIVAISLQDLLTQTEEERALHAKTIRTRLDELMDKLQIRFPVYLMFTKADLVSGFTEYFEDFSRDDREQVWGVSLPNAAGADQAPDFDFLHVELIELTQALYSRVLYRIHQERDSQRRAAIQGFPQQFENAKVIAEQFVRQTFAFNRFKYQPYLRGVYFSSGTQDGTPIDRLMASVAANFGFTRDVAQMPHQQGKSYFLSRLFREVIFPEAELVGSNVAYERTIRWLQRGAYAAMFLGLIGLGVVWSGSVMRHKGYMGEVQAHVNDYEQAQARVQNWNQDIRQVLPSLNALVLASQVYDQEDHPVLSGLGLYDPRVDQSADAAYREKLLEEYRPRLLATMEKSLLQGYDGGDLYDTFRVYMMFKKVDKMERDRVQNWFTSQWERDLRGEGTRRKELEFHLDNLLSIEDLPPAQLNDKLVKDTRALLLREKVAQRVYSRLRSNPLYNRKVDLLSMYGAAVRTSYKIDSSTQRALSIPVMFTKEGYDNIDLSPNSPLVADIVNERWVLTDDENAKIDFIEEDLDDVSQQVQDLYLSEYIQVWDEVYRNLSVTEFRTLQHAEEVLANMVDPVYSPLVAILQVGKMNTQLKPPKEDVEALASKNPKKGRKAKLATSLLLSQYEGTKVDKHFRDLNALASESGSGVPPVANIVDKVQSLHQFIGDVSIAPDPSQQAFNVARDRFASGAANAITGLKIYAQSMPESVRNWLNTLADQSWKVLLQSAHGYADSEWRALVYRPYSQALQGRYPLNRTSRDEMTLYDFSEFFKPGGTVDAYFEQFMAPFVQTRGGWRNRVVDGYSLGFSNAVLRQMRNAQAIKDIFYRESPDTISVTMELRPRAMDERDARFTLDVGDERLVYQHGPKFWKTVRWKADQDNMRVRMVFEDVQGSQYEQSYQGAWAWFRLLDASYVEKTGQSSTYLVTFAAGDERGTRRDAHKITYEVKTKSVDNPLRRDVLNAFRCPETISP